ncbi:F-box protein [Cardamine amara subsp. amara]|uniref:F-box protein n=1 Tax=Cardamine amara subsp. amara TaxID=228776 RepID=A0ABD1ADP1_CARAN
MMTLSDLPRDLLREILSRVPLTSLRSVRCTCKTWNALSKAHIFGKAAVASRRQFWGFITIDSKVCSLRFDLQGISNEDFADPSIKQITILNQVEISNVFHCEGLLLCVTKDYSRLVVWNPYLGQTRWIQPTFIGYNMYALGYDNNNRNHKILRILDNYFYIDSKKAPHLWFEIYDFNSNSWRVLDVNPDLYIHQSYVSLKGNTYFSVQENISEDEEIPTKMGNYLLCFDFTLERFGPPLPLPFHSYLGEVVTLSCVREEQVAVLYQSVESIEIWITSKIEPNAVSWSKFLKVDITPHNGFPNDFEAESFFIDEEKKVIVASDINIYEPNNCYQLAYITGEDGHFKSVEIREAQSLGKTRCYYTPMFSSYAPSLVQL